MDFVDDDDDTPSTDDAQTVNLEKHNDSQHCDADDTSDVFIEGLPSGYIYLPDQDCIFQMRSSGDLIPICGPLKVTHSLTAPNGRSNSLRIETLDRFRTTHQHIVLLSNIVDRPREVIAHLTDRGLAVPGTVDQIAKLLRLWKPAKTGWLAEEFGWIKTLDQRVYVTKNGAVLRSKENVQRPVFSRAKSDAANTSGSLQGWQDGVASLALGNPLAIFAISSALAGSLLEILNLDGGGFNIHGRTSCGKTTALYAAMSVFGSPSMMLRWNGTPTAFEREAVHAKDSLLALDEILTKNAKLARELSAILYTLANGTGKARSNRQLDQITPATWKTILLTTAEAPLSKIYETAHLEMPEGLSVRLADIPAQSWSYGSFADLHGAPSAATFSDQFKAACLRDCGHAGPKFVQNLINALDTENRAEKISQLFRDIQKVVVKHVNQFIDSPIDGPERRVLDRFAAISMAGQLAYTWKIVPWTASEVRSAIDEVAKLWLLQRRELIRCPTQDILERVRAFFVTHVDEFADFSEAQIRLQKQHIGWHDSEIIAISAATFGTEIAEPLSLGEAARLLHQRGVLVPGGEERSLQQRRSPKIDPNRGREYWIRKAALGFG